MAAMSGNGIGVDRGSQVGVLTRTIIASPVIRWILPARVRHRKLNDVVFVGEDFIEVKQVRSGGHVEPVISKRDLGSRICCAKVFTIEDPLVSNEDDILQHNINYEDLPGPVLPAQLLVLTLEANVVMFLYLARGDGGTVHFRYQVVPLPTWPDALRQTGDYIAIDPQSRAMAIASRGGQVSLYSTKSRQEFQEQLVTASAEWCPITQAMVLDLHGAIQHLAFLYPSRTDPAHVILLVVVTDPATKRTRLRWFDWRVDLGIRKLQRHEPIPIHVPRCVASLVIPLCNTNFLLVYGKNIHFYRDLLSGTPTVSENDTIDCSYAPLHPETSPRYPMWSNWCRPVRSTLATQDQDSIYLCREDGTVFHVVTSLDGGIQSSCAGDLDCHVGEAFASLGDDWNPDLLAVAADMSTGRIVSIGNWPSPRLPDRGREETMGMKLVEVLPNWASVTDMIVAKVSSSNSRSSHARDSIFLTSGRQPYGSITEVRKGLEARLLTYIPLSDLNNMLDVWAMPNPPTGSIILLLSTPSSTVIYNVLGNLDESEITNDPGIFSTTDRTLVAGTTQSNQLVQVTEKRIIVAGNINAGFEDIDETLLDSDESIICAAIEPELDLVLTCNSTPDGHHIAVHTCPTNHNTDNALVLAGPDLKLSSRPLCMASAQSYDRALVLVAGESGVVQVYTCRSGSIAALGSFCLDANDVPLACDQMILLHAEDDHFLTVCSTRDGRLFTTPVTISPFSTGPSTERPFGLSTVKLTRVPCEVDCAYATCGTDTCLLTLRGLVDLNIQSIWVTDKQRPELLQNNVFGCARLPHPDRLSGHGDLNALGRSLVLLSKDELWIASLGHNTSAVPRQIPVSGTPYRLAYANVLSQRSLICASMKTELTKSGDCRRCTPGVDFVSMKNNEITASHTMAPGEEIYCLLEWSPMDNEKAYQLILVGSKYLHNGKEEDVRGKITFLQPHKEAGIKVQHTVSFEAPVFAMALYDEFTFAICYGKYLTLYRFSSEKHKVKPICRPLMMASSGASITCQAPMIYVTTMADSMVAFCVEDESVDGAYLFSLVVSSAGPRTDVGISHAIVQSKDDIRLAIMTTRRREIIGLALPDHLPTSSGVPRTANMVFEANLPQSITRVRKCDIRPAWQPAPNVLVDGLVGCCTDGSVVGLAILGEKLWRRLFWIQRLCEWSSVVSPHSFEQPNYTETNGDRRGWERALPIGLTGLHDIMLAAPDEPHRAARDMHIDGDVLARVLDRGGASALRLMIEETSQRQDHVGEWVRTHLEEELAAVSGSIAELSILLNSWI